ncbi:hypothetical protein V8F06_013887 [Rhypophila decipiens]
MDSNDTCTATLMFSSTEFPNILYAFDNDRCPQLSLLEFVLPPQVPNGDVVILWQCAGQLAQFCYQASITEGLGEPNNVQYAQNGTVSCLNLASTSTRSSQTGISMSSTKTGKVSQITPTSSHIDAHGGWNTTHPSMSSARPPWSNTTLVTSTASPSTTPIWQNTTSAISSTSQTMSLSAPPMTARAAKNVPESCFVMAAMLATLASA